MTLYMKYLAIHLKKPNAVQSFLYSQCGRSVPDCFLRVYLGVFYVLPLWERCRLHLQPSSPVLYHRAYGFCHQRVLFRGFDTFPSTISNGEFDRIMVRPRGIVFQVLASKIDLSRIGRLVQAVVVLIYAIPTSGVVWSPLKVITLVLMLLGGIAVFQSVCGVRSPVLLHH